MAETARADDAVRTGAAHPEPFHARHCIGSGWLDSSIHLDSFDPATGTRIGTFAEGDTVWINDWAVVYDAAAEGGCKQSGTGHLNGVSAINDLVEYRTTIHEVAL